MIVLRLSELLKSNNHLGVPESMYLRTIANTFNILCELQNKFKHSFNEEITTIVLVSKRFLIPNIEGTYDQQLLDL